MFPQQAVDQSLPTTSKLLTEDQLCQWANQFDVSGTESKLIWSRMYRRGCTDPNRCIDKIHSASLRAIQAPCSDNIKTMAKCLLKKLLFGHNNIAELSNRLLKKEIIDQVSERPHDIIKTQNDQNQWRICCFDKLVELAGYQDLLHPQAPLPPKSPEELQQWANSLDISSQNSSGWKQCIRKSKKFSKDVTEGLMAINTASQNDQEMAKTVLRKLFSIDPYSDSNDLALRYYVQFALNEEYTDIWEFQTLVRLAQIADVAIIPDHIKMSAWFKPLSTT